MEDEEDDDDDDDEAASSSANCISWSSDAGLDGAGICFAGALDSPFERDEEEDEGGGDDEEDEDGSPGLRSSDFGPEVGRGEE